MSNEPVLFSEPGARWHAIAYGPIFCGVVLIAEVVLGIGVHVLITLFFALILAGIVWLQVIAARTHVSVELTPTWLRQGTETLLLSEIVDVLPEPDENRRTDEPWESARSLGELANVPRGRTAIGLTLSGGQLVRAWAKDDEGLRTELTGAVERLQGEQSDS
jgi:hypothetical protein